MKWLVDGRTGSLFLIGRKYNLLSSTLALQSMLGFKGPLLHCSCDPVLRMTWIPEEKGESNIGIGAACPAACQEACLEQQDG